MATAQTILDAFNNTYPRCSTTRALQLLNDANEEILMHIPLTRSSIDLALTVGQPEYPLDESVIKIWSVRYFQDASTMRTLREATIDGLDVFDPEWRSLSPDDPERWYTGANMTTGTLGLVATPSSSTLLVVGATNASPIVITTNAPHGLDTGDMCLVTDVTGNTAANGDFNNGWTVTVLSATTFSLNGSSGNGAYVSGGLVVCGGSPRVTFDCTQKTDNLTGASNMPLTPQIRDLYVDCMRWKYAKEKVPEEAVARKQAYDDSLALQVAATMQRSGRVEPQIRLVNQRRGWRRRMGGDDSEGYKWWQGGPPE
jgi:hypothetical protein